MRLAVSICLLAACAGAAASHAQAGYAQAAPPSQSPDQSQIPTQNPDQSTTQTGAPASQQPYSRATKDSPYRYNIPPLTQPVRPGSATGSPSEGEGFHVPASYVPAYPVQFIDGQGSTYIPMDSWIYPALDRLHGLGYLDTAFLGMRPWTRRSILQMLSRSEDAVVADDSPGGEEAQEIFLAVEKELSPDMGFHGIHGEADTVYTRFLGITDTPLNDSFHLGQTVINDYGRQYQAGINNISGASGRMEAGRFTLFVRAEYLHTPSALGYSTALASYLSDADGIPFNLVPNQATDPVGPILTRNNFDVVEATLSYHLLKHEISFGKQDHWWGPGKGGAFAWSTNAENIYAFQINRVEPMYIPFFDKFFGPIRYDFFIGSLQGHTTPNHPYVHAEKISLQPTKNFELGFERTVIWGGEGHEPVTIHTFLRSFFSTSGTDFATKTSSNDPGARFSAFDFNYRLPYLRDWFTLYADSFAHDDINPVDAPRRAAIRSGLYLSHTPFLPKLDWRAEGTYTDTPTSRSVNGQFYFYEYIQKQGTTNKGFLFTDPVGREDKGGQAWVTYHLSPSDHIQFHYRRVKAAKDFIPGGTTQNEYGVDLVKTLSEDVEVHVAAQYEGWKAPIYKYGAQNDTGVWGGITWYPHKGVQLER